MAQTCRYETRTRTVSYTANATLENSGGASASIIHRETIHLAGGGGGGARAGGTPHGSADGKIATGHEDSVTIQTGADVDANNDTITFADGGGGTTQATEYNPNAAYVFIEPLLDDSITLGNIKVCSEYYEVESEILDQTLAPTPVQNTIIIDSDSILPDAQINIYKEQAGLFGYIGTTKKNEFIDKNYAPDLSDSPPVYKNPFSGNNSPVAAAYHKQRIVYGNYGNNFSLVRINGSGVARFNNFDSSYRQRIPMVMSSLSTKTNLKTSSILFPLSVF